ncbi:MAG: sigma-54 dependent transcriptional regulator [Acidobacteriota bacterium]
MSVPLQLVSIRSDGTATAGFEHDLVGSSGPMQQLYVLLAKVAAADCTVMLRGESGTGKELAARAIHRNSPRAARPFVAVSCAALAPTLIESELFGHEKGAFTDAHARKPGKLEAADGGALLLDEIGEMPLPLQAKLLRVIQEREFERVGGTDTVRVNIRLMAATHRDLRGECERGHFREDLFYRLNVVSITLPPLRERREDIPLLARHFVAKYAAHRGPGLEISPEAWAHLLNYDWPGNVRELENAIERAVVLGAGNQILPGDLPEAVLERCSRCHARPDDIREALKLEKREMVLEAMRRSRGNYVEAAKLLGIHPNSLHRLVRRLGLKPEIERPVRPFGCPPA